MKRILVVLSLCLIGTITAFAQCEEIKKVETEKVDTATEKGFEFSNLNDCTVTIETELRYPTAQTKHGYLVKATKSFVVEAKSTYIWKVPLKITGFGYSEDTYVVFKAFKCP